MTKQVQIRGAIAATQESRTLVSRELDINTTDARITVHNGSTSGGIPHINYKDHINQEYTYAAASGTNALTISLPIAPAAYAAGQKFCFKAAATNTAGATLNVNSLGAKTLKKKDTATGTIAVLAAGDIIIGGIYVGYYDGTDIIIEGISPAAGLTSVSQGDLNTSIGTWSSGDPTSLTLLGGSAATEVRAGDSNDGIVMPSGQYGYGLQGRGTLASRFYGWVQGGDTTSYTTQALPFIAGATTSGDIMYGQVRYVTASPPYDLGDGEVGGFIFLLVNKAGKTISSYIADAPPWAYNGKTNITPCKICRSTGKKYRKIQKKLTFEEIIAGVPNENELEEITQEIKNRDMGDILHPFGNIKKDQKVVLLDPMSDVVRNMVDHQNAGNEEISEMVSTGKIYADNKALNRRGPKGVMQVGLKVK